MIGVSGDDGDGMVGEGGKESMKALPERKRERWITVSAVALNLCLSFGGIRTVHVSLGSVSIKRAHSPWDMDG